LRYSRTKGTTVTPAATACGAAARAIVPSFGRLFATIARTPLRCMRASTSAIGNGAAASSL
jgi:hypothetical protein